VHPLVTFQPFRWIFSDAACVIIDDTDLYG